MTLDVEAVSAAVNQIDLAIGDIKTRNEKFLSLLEEKNNETKGKFSLIKSLKERVTDEEKNISAAIAATESIKESIRKYTAMAEDADDDSAFRR
jgi:hypothetical protein